MGFRVIPLEIDKVIYKEHGGQASLNAHLERSIILDMIAHLDGKGFKLRGGTFGDGDGDKVFNEPMEALDFYWEVVDCAHLYFCKEGFPRHSMFLVHGNGIDVISDWIYTSGDADGFDAAMGEFVSNIDEAYPRQEVE